MNSHGSLYTGVQSKHFTKVPGLRVAWVLHSSGALLCKGFPGGSDGKVPAYNAGDPDLIPGSGRSAREGNGNPLQYSCLENPMDGEPGGLLSMGSLRVRHD